ncbi:hypothetical protein Mapa_016744 [Marchantia paleacea]|nr:hypothetical protein Mapa_016744 [Marchantia paleacea]
MHPLLDRSQPSCEGSPDGRMSRTPDESRPSTGGDEDEDDVKTRRCVTVISVGHFIIRTWRKQAHSLMPACGEVGGPLSKGKERKGLPAHIPVRGFLPIRCLECSSSVGPVPYERRAIYILHGWHLARDCQGAH